MIRRYTLNENNLSRILSRRKARNYLHRTAKTLAEHNPLVADRLLCYRCSSELKEGQEVVSKSTSGLCNARYYCWMCAKTVHLI